MRRTHDFASFFALALVCSSCTSVEASDSPEARAPRRATRAIEPDPSATQAFPRTSVEPLAPALSAPNAAPAAPSASAAPPIVPGAAEPYATLTPIARDASNPTSAVDTLVGRIVDPGEPGMAVLVMQNGRTVFSRGYGIADTSTGAPIDARTNFRLASVTKQFTAMVVMMLAEQGVLSYDDPIERYVPDFVAGHPQRREVTIRHLLTMTSGIPDYIDLLERQGVLDSPTSDTADVVRRIARWHSHGFRAGTRYEYSNSNYVLLAEIATRASRQPFGNLLRTRILQALSMPNAVVFDRADTNVPNRARGYDAEENGTFTLDDSNSPTLGDDGIFASLEDFVQWERALSSPVLVRNETLELAFTSAVLPNGERTEYGFGWCVEGEGRDRRLSHDGSWVGFRTGILRAPALGTTVVVLSNRDDVDTDAIAADVLALFAPTAAHGI